VVTDWIRGAKRGSMMDTRGVRGAVLIAVFCGGLAGACACAAQGVLAWQSAVAHAAKIAPEARIVVLDSATGRLVASSQLAEAARTLAYPGSAMKPLILYGLVAAGRWDPSRRIACSRELRIAGHELNCSHPSAPAMDARLALAWSCNTYFATVAATLERGELRTLLAPTGLLGQTGLLRQAGLAGSVGNEATADFKDPQTADENRLAVLGINGVRVTPLEFAVAYRWLALQMAARQATAAEGAAAQVVQAGLEDSASFGIAGAADLGGVLVAGKTGTASGKVGYGTTHGWFICLAPAQQTSAIIVVYLPAGNGNDAAHVAADILAHSPLKQAKP
jgi:cell division protein FtsI/penicillin-binding protein 2